MFSKFKLNEISYLSFKEYESVGLEYYTEIKPDIESSLKEFIGIDGVIDGTTLQESWFPTKQ